MTRNEYAEAGADRLRDLSAQDLARLGREHVAYVKAVIVDDEAAFAVHAADGRQVAVFDSRELAEAMIRTNDLEPLSVH